MNLRLQGGAKLRKQLERGAQVVKRPFLGPRGDRHVAALRAELRKVAAAGAESGVSFAPVHRFGTRPATIPPLGGPSSSYWQGWTGGRGSVVRKSPRRIAIVNTIPWAVVHRGGVTTARPRVTVIKPKRISRDGRPAMFHALSRRFGVRLKATTLRRGLRVPSRPHADPQADVYQEAVRKTHEAELAEVFK